MDLQFLTLVASFGALLLLGASVSFDQKDLPVGVKLLTNTGIAFVFLGFLAGPQVLAIVSRNFIRTEVAPLLTLGLGWIGFLYGTHFEFRRMRRFAPSLYMAGLFESLVTCGVITTVCYFVLGYFQVLTDQSHAIYAALALGICAAGTAPSGVYLLQNNRTLSRHNVQTLQFFAAIDDLPAIVLLGILFAVANNPHEMIAISGLQRLLLSVLIGVGVGIVTHWVFPLSASKRHNALILFGATALASGFSETLGISAIFVTTLAGIVFANLSHLKEQAYGVFSAREYEIYAVFLLLSGVLIQFQLTNTVLVMIPIFIVLRMIGKLLGAYLAKLIFIRDARISRDIGLGLLFQGGMALAIAIEIELSYSLPLKGLLITIVIAGVVINDLLAPSIAGFAMQWERGRS